MAQRGRSGHEREMEPLLFALSGVLAEVPEAALRATLPLWSVVQVREQSILWRQGRPADAFALVLAGALDVLVDGTVIGRVEAGDTIGESALYTGRRGDSPACARACGRTRWCCRGRASPSCARWAARSTTRCCGARSPGRRTAARCSTACSRNCRWPSSRRRRRRLRGSSADCGVGWPAPRRIRRTARR
ncbi:cyclic nucleotide-binding domain-containing protein [Nannocystis pusilla]|uniref:cyclic nucleotide-binding domain-containing protein n=1 Tax=Nannocystis pusilla TaxID=889268 RepID=UPI003B808449